MKLTTTLALDKGIYDDECTELCLKLEATVTLLMVMKGNRGSGFSLTLQPDRGFAPELLPGLLEDIAAQIRAQLRGQVNN